MSFEMFLLHQLRYIHLDITPLLQWIYKNETIISIDPKVHFLDIEDRKNDQINRSLLRENSSWVTS